MWLRRLRPLERGGGPERGRPAFLWARSILRAPRWYADLSDVLQAKCEDAGVTVVDPYTFFGLIKLEVGE